MMRGTWSGLHWEPGHTAKSNGQRSELLKAIDEAHIHTNIPIELAQHGQYRTDRQRGLADEVGLQRN